MGRIYLTDKGKELRAKIKYNPYSEPVYLKEEVLWFFWAAPGQTRNSYLGGLGEASFEKDLANMAIDELINEGLVEER